MLWILNIDFPNASTNEPKSIGSSWYKLSLSQFSVARIKKESLLAITEIKMPLANQQFLWVERQDIHKQNRSRSFHGLETPPTDIR